MATPEVQDLAASTGLRVEAQGPGFVARVSGIDLRRPLTEAQREAIERAIWTYGVLVFENQPLSAEEQVAFAATFGPLDTGLQTKLLNKVQNRFASAAVSDISNVDADGGVAARNHKQTVMTVGNMYWHSDASYEHHPFRYSILACQVAASWGGHTQFADLRAAYDALDARTRRLIEDKSAWFYANYTRDVLGIEDDEAHRRTYPPVRWPMVRTHPGSGRKVIWVDNKVFRVDDMSVAEGRALVHELIEHIGQRERVYSHEWHAGDVVMWDNRSVLHRGRRFDLAEKREMRRVSTVDDSASLGAGGIEDIPGPNLRVAPSSRADNA